MFNPISRKELIKKLRRLRFEGLFSGGKHQFMRKGHFKVFIPNPHGKDIGIILLSQIIKDLKISKDKFLDL